MPRSVAAYLADILDACDAIDAVLAGVDLDAYLEQRSIRSSVEREFIIIGEASLVSGALAPNSRSAYLMLVSSLASETCSRTTMLPWTMRRCTVWPQRILVC